MSDAHSGWRDGGAKPVFEEDSALSARGPGGKSVHKKRVPTGRSGTRFWQMTGAGRIRSPLKGRSGV